MSAASAAMDYRPLSVLSDPYSGSVHYSAAVCRPVSGNIVKVKTGQAVRAVVAVQAARSGVRNAFAARRAGKAVGVVYIFFVIIMSSVFQRFFLLKINYILKGGHTGQIFVNLPYEQPIVVSYLPKTQAPSRLDFY